LIFKMLTTNFEKYKKELTDIVNIFFDSVEVHHKYQIINGLQIDSISVAGVESVYTEIVKNVATDTILYNREILHNSKNALYKAMSSHLGLQNEWGSITGVHPLALIDRAGVRFESQGQIVKFLMDKYFVSLDKAVLLAKVWQTQLRVLSTNIVDLQGAVDTNLQSIYDKGFEYFRQLYSGFVNLYIHIPFCPSRCSYCSFVTSKVESDSCKGDYVKFLTKEIYRVLELLQGRHKQVLSIYIGGGTPSSLDNAQLETLLDSLKSVVAEFTFEAGRVDTLGRAKLQLLSKYNIDRICINPQTLNDKTLKSIGRLHSSTAVIDCYKIASEFDWDINMDLICGLQGESDIDFKNTLDEILALAPSNITLHTLCKKRGATDKKLDYNPYAKQMLEYAYLELEKAGYRPYYIYKQKKAIDNLENCGFSKVGKECIHNITTMADLVPTVGVGAGAITKYFLQNGKIGRKPSPLDVKLYLERWDDILKTKESIVNSL